jgi:hypothetical protein
LALVLLAQGSALAVTDFLTLFNNKYGTAATVLNTCNVCHTAAIPALNSYGQDFSNTGSNEAALDSIASLDSDGDGATNIAEINARTFPGDASSTPPSPPSGGLPVPTSQLVFNYAGVVSPVSSVAAGGARPVGLGQVATGGSTVDVTLGLAQTTGPVDVYWGFQINGGDIFILTAGGQFQSVSAGVVPLFAGSTGNFNQSLFGPINLNVLPAGNYNIYMLIAPAGSTDFASFYLYITSFATSPALLATAQWTGSGHADATAEAFIHWNEEGNVPTSCARCHTTSGYRDFIGDDGSPAGSVENPAPLNQVINCGACHNPTAEALNSATFPSGVTISNAGPSSRCMQCHQGRAHTGTVNTRIATAGVGDDTVSADLSFINIHYFAAAASLFGGQVMGGYQYEGKTYDIRNYHVAEFDTCVECHNQHSLEVRVNECSRCHTGVNTVENLKNVRMAASIGVDYDGDGNTTEGIFFEIETLRAMLLTAIRQYGANVAGTAIAYNPASHPYYFVDTNNNGVVDSGESTGYNAWTPRLLKAAYNYQTSLKDPGNFAHNPKYHIQLLYDSIQDLNVALDPDVNLSSANREDEGHFNGAVEAFRHWDEDGEVSASCAKCHGKDGLPSFLANGTSVAAELPNGLTCATCHDDQSTFTRRAAGPVTFPSGRTATLGDESNLCMNCHSGRESKVSVDAKIGDSEGPYSFTNIHYYAAAASFFGTDVLGGYEYDGKTYVGEQQFPGAHTGLFDTCVRCHAGIEADRDGHVTRPSRTQCAACHPALNDVGFKGFRPSTPDYDGDGNTTESRRDEIAGLEAALLARIQTYAATVIGTAVAYNGASYPYLFVDDNGNGLADPGETGRYTELDAKLLRAAYNYQVSQKEPCGYIHNADYIAQLLIDSISDLGGNVGAFNRP